MANIWGYDERVMREAGEAADGVVWVMGAARWGDEAPGMYTVREISRMSDPEDRKYRSVHYIRGICSMFYLKEAMEWADLNGGISGPNVRLGMYQQENWIPAGMEGVCLPASWKRDDHRGVARIVVYRGKVSGATDGPIGDLVRDGVIQMDRVFSVDIPRRPEWLGI
jgi:branched-chain amino acid transport system substrate-binding protein